MCESCGSYLVMCTAPPPVLIAMPAPELAWIRLASRLRLGQGEGEGEGEVRVRVRVRVRTVT